MTDDALERFSDPVRAWFSTTFSAPTTAQARGWPVIADGAHTLLTAPTGSGKTLTAFLWAIDRLATSPVPPRERRLRVLYLSPLRALAVDVDRNLRAPIEGIRLAGERTGVEVHRPDVGVRTGDTSAQERRRLSRTPPDILITTPESLYLLLTSKARETLRHVDTVIVDEIHAMAATKRGSHLTLSLERLEREVTRGGLNDDEPSRPAPQRIALSATQRPLDEIARFLGGSDARGQPRPVTIVDAGEAPHLELEVVVPVADLSDLGELVEAGRDLDVASGAAAAGPARRSIWPAIHPRLLDLVLANRSTLIFVNARRLAERLAAKLNDLNARREHEAALRAQGLTGDDLLAALEDEPYDVDELVKAHHGSLSRERRLAIEDELRSGRLRGLVATSSLELGIDMGAVDLVVQVASPGAVSRGLQRIGRAGHQVGAPSRGVLFPKFRGDLVETAVVTRRMHDGAIEPTRYPRNPLDVLAQHIVAMVAMEPWQVEDLAALVRQAAPFTDLSDAVLSGVLDLLDGRYPSEEFGELRPRIVWDRLTGQLRARAGAQRLAVTNPGTIPDRGLFGVFLPDGSRVGELDEEMVHESRPGETFVLGASTWRIEDITYDRVVVSPAPGQPGKLPFWHGDSPGRPYELGSAIGAFVREVHEAATTDRDAEVARLQAEHDLDAWAADNLVAYLDEQATATGVLPDDRTIVVERFRDELGDWRICLLSPFGARVHTPWAMAIERHLTTLGFDPEVMWSDDGIVLRLEEGVAGGLAGGPLDAVAGGLAGGPLDAVAGGLPGGPLDAVAGGLPAGSDGGGGVPDAADAPGTIRDAHRDLVDAMLVAPDEVEQLVVDQLAGTALYTTSFREAAGRALLLPRRRPGQRTALWQQRQRAAGLLSVAARYPGFPLLLEATRECLQDVFDLPALTGLLTALQQRTVRVVTVDTTSASPFAQSLLFGWVGQYLYDYDAPLAERRAAALALDRDLLRELLGGDELRDLLDAEVLAVLERELQRLPALHAEAADTGAADTGAATDTRATDNQPADAQPGDAEPADAQPTERTSTLDLRARDVDDLHELLRRLGPLSHAELAERSRADDVTTWVATLLAERRAIEVRVAGHDRIAAAEDAARLRDAAGVALPPGLPQVFTEPVDDPLGDLVARYARTHGPFTVAACASRYGVPDARVLATLRWLGRQDRVVEGEFRPDGADREWIDTEVLRRLKRRSLAALRAEVEPVEPDALARFLPAWQEVRAATGRQRRRGTEALIETVAQLQGIPIPASVLEADVLPTRIDDYRPSDLDQLIAAGDVVWVGAGPLGIRDGRVVLALRHEAASLVPPGDAEPPDGPLHDALRHHLDIHGASFWPELLGAAGVPDQDAVIDALWDLVWAGELTNDTYAPVRAVQHGRARTSARGRPRPGRLTRVGPPAAAGRWSSTGPVLAARPAPTARAHALAGQLLERHGVLTREALRVESVPGGFAAIYPVLRAMEEAGRIRRGYLVAGAGATQFALAGAVDRLRQERHEAAPVLLAATDPAQPYGAALAWPPVAPAAPRPARTAGAHVVLVEGRPAAYIDRSGRHLTTFEPPTDPARWLETLAQLVASGRRRKLEIVRIDGQDAYDAPLADALEAAGFTRGYRGLSLRDRT